jgi:hypothetical protein
MRGGRGETNAGVSRQRDALVPSQMILMDVTWVLLQQHLAHIDHGMVVVPEPFGWAGLPDGLDRSG